MTHTAGTVYNTENTPIRTISFSNLFILVAIWYDVPLKGGDVPEGTGVLTASFLIALRILNSAINPRMMKNVPSASKEAKGAITNPM